MKRPWAHFISFLFQSPTLFHSPTLVRLPASTLSFVIFPTFFSWVSPLSQGNENALPQ